MSEYMNLIGAEDVQRAAHRMTDAAREMNRAAGTIQATLDQFLQRFDELVTRMEIAMEPPETEEGHE